MDKKILTGILGIIAITFMIKKSNKKFSIDEIKNKLLKDNLLNENEKENLQHNVFPIASDEEIRFIYNLIYKKIRYTDNIDLYNSIKNKYEIFG